MELISVQRRGELIASAKATSKLELRDNYAVDAATMEAWRTGGAEAARARVRPYARELATLIETGQTSSRRIKVLSEPLSEYMRQAYDVAGELVNAGEDIRWLPRRLTSSLLLPGNDFIVLDDKAVVFNVLDGDDCRAEQQLWYEPEIVAQCREAFEAAWTPAVPHRNYHPA